MTNRAPDWYDVIDGTWPAASYRQSGLWTLREGQGGGNRVSAATLNDTSLSLTPKDVEQAEKEMQALGQHPIFMIRDGDTYLDEQLKQRGYLLRDPVVIYACNPEDLMDIPLPRVTVLNVWEPLAIMREIWASGGIGQPRLEIMNRAKGPKIGFLGRHRDKPAGVAFAAIHDGIAMVHAVEILPHQRRSGMGAWTMRAAAFWAADNGARTLSVMCTRDNIGANALYTSLGMQAVGQYHYRHLPIDNGA